MCPPLRMIAIILWALSMMMGSHGFQLRIARFDVASEPSSGMDGGAFGVLSLGGGEFRIKICNELSGICCETKDPLETMNNDWETSEINFFAGDALQDCENFWLQDIIQIRLYHEGRDGGKLDAIRLHGSDFGYGEAHRGEYFCPVGIKLDDYEAKSLNCYLKSPFYNNSLSCNGDEAFCSRPYNNFTFLGAHNAGTGEDASSISNINCAFKNHDLSIKEMLDYGIRFFDFDVIQSHRLYNCDGLETGHGRYPSIGLYRCFGRMEGILMDLMLWLNVTGNRDVVTLYFGAIDFEESTRPALRELLNKPFIRKRLNSDYKSGGKGWPTLGEAIQAKKNVFVFMRTKEVLEEPFIHREVPYKHLIRKDNFLCEGDVVVTSTFKKGPINGDCETSVEHASALCHDKGDFLKVAAFGRGFSELLCLWESARFCNSRLLDIIQACRDSSTARINFIQMDYPNYLGPRGIIPIDAIYKLNKE